MSTRAEPAGKIRRHPGRVASGVQHYANRTKTFHVKRFGTIEAVKSYKPAYIARAEKCAITREAKHGPRF